MPQIYLKVDFVWSDVAGWLNDPEALNRKGILVQSVAGHDYAVWPRVDLNTAEISNQVDSVPWYWTNPGLYGLYGDEHSPRSLIMEGFIVEHSFEENSYNQFISSTPRPTEPFQVPDIFDYASGSWTYKNIMVPDYVWVSSYYPDLSLFTAGHDVINLGSLEASQFAAVTPQTDLYSALGGNDDVTLPSDNVVRSPTGPLAFDRQIPFNGGSGNDTIRGALSVDNTFRGIGINDSSGQNILHAGNKIDTVVYAGTSNSYTYNYDASNFFTKAALVGRPDIRLVIENGLNSDTLVDRFEILKFEGDGGREISARTLQDYVIVRLMVDMMNISLVKLGGREIPDWASNTFEIMRGAMTGFIKAETLGDFSRTLFVDVSTSFVHSLLTAAKKVALVASHNDPELKAVLDGHAMAIEGIWRDGAARAYEAAKNGTAPFGEAIKPTVEAIWRSVENSLRKEFPLLDNFIPSSRPTPPENPGDFTLPGEQLHAVFETSPGQRLDFSNLSDVTGVGALVLAGDGRQIIIGSKASDHILAGAGNDAILASAGNDLIHGGLGFDKVQLPGLRSDYILKTQSDGSTLATGQVGASLLVDVEAVQFGNAPTYRFFNTIAGGHLYTTSVVERDTIQQNLPHLRYEGQSYLSADPGMDLSVEVYRFFNTKAGGHLFTASTVERDAVMADLPEYNFEGVAFNMSTQPGAGLEPIFRFFNTTAGGHFFTPSELERDTIIETLNNLTYEGVAFYAPTTQVDPIFGV